MRGLAPFWIDPQDTSYRFPDVSLALTEPDGLLAIGGDLSPRRLEAAYRRGIFPWFNDDQPILWWSPNPRAVLYPEKLKVSRSLRKTLKKELFTITFDKAFAQVMHECSKPRPYQHGTWITGDMIQAYRTMFQLGHAHSVECWQHGCLVGGLYGLSFGKMFFGESMFSKVTDASKVAFFHLVRQLRAWEFPLIDCQVQSQHLASLGAQCIPRERFIGLLDRYCNMPSNVSSWKFDHEH